MNALKLKKILAVAVAAVGLAAVAAPKVTIDKIENGNVWSTKKVTYVVSDVPEPDGTYVYNLAFDVTAYSVTTNIKMGAAQNGTFTYTLDTAAIFGEARKDPKAKFRVSIEKGWDLTPVQLWENGPYFARCNIGATAPQEAGYYFWWGDTVGYKRNEGRWDAADESTKGFSFESGKCPTWCKGLKELYDDGNGYIDANSADAKLKPEYDAATAHLGGTWRMPTKAEFDTLVVKCTTKWVSNWNGTGKAGLIVTGKDAYASKSIFLPAVGFGDGSGLQNSGPSGRYWSSTPPSATVADIVGSGLPWELCFSNYPNLSVEVSDLGCYLGLPVRPVR